MYPDKPKRREERKLDSTLTPEGTLMSVFYWCQENFDLSLSVNLKLLILRTLSDER
tara:strand:- start:257 stop:424 length:168 start_codon:yes stop_codon:yes gene_type:complete